MPTRLPNPDNTIIQPAKSATEVVADLVEAITDHLSDSARRLLELADDVDQQARLARVLAIDDGAALSEVIDVSRALATITAAFGGYLAELEDDEDVRAIEREWVACADSEPPSRFDREPLL
jgi:hypothetical protein